jgi:hypothetical protein
MKTRAEVSGVVGVAVDERRRHDRVTGPFDGQRVNALDTPVTIYDLSEGGCFVNSLHDQQSDVVITLKINLPYEGWIALRAVTLYRKPGFGFAVRFIDVSEESAARLKRSVEKIKARRPYDR